MIELHPALPFFAAGFLSLFFCGRMRGLVQLAAPFFSFALVQSCLSRNVDVITLQPIFGYSLTLLRLDKLSLFFSYAFILFAFLANLYSLHAREKALHAASGFYVGSSLGAVLAGDFVTLFIFWETMALASAVLIWNQERPASRGAILRYLMVHLTGGLFFFTGVLLMFLTKDDLTFQRLGFDTAGRLIFIAFAINAALVPVHTWLPDAYAEGTPAGSVYLSAFTTKVAVYAFARGFWGSEMLIWLGLLAAIYGVVYALMENDMRRLLSYHIVCQVGYMICGIGLGSELGLNAGTAHAVGNILFKGLLFMAAGALIHSTGKYKLSELGGVAARDRRLVFFYFIGALAIAGAPLLNGYVSKALLLKAASTAHRDWMEPVLLVVAVGTFMSIGLKLAYFAFWGGSHKAEWLRPVPWNMHLAMAGTAFVCLATGIYPAVLFRFFPYPVHAHIYTPDHVLHSVELLAGTMLAFLMIVRHLHTKAFITLDFDWFYRRGGDLFLKGICLPFSLGQMAVQQKLSAFLGNMIQYFNRLLPKQSIPAVAWPLVTLIGASCLTGLLILGLWAFKPGL